MHNLFYIALILLVVVCFLIFILYKFGGSGGGGGKQSTNNMSLDNSDCPIPPNTLQFNNTYAPPKRNCNITLGSAARNKKIKSDPVNGKYYDIYDEIDYVL